MIGETILVIDTDDETIQIIVSALEAEDYLVFTAPSGDVGITMAKKIDPSLIFINPAIAGESGLDICKTIHSTEQLKAVPIIVLSAFEGAKDSRYASIYGIVDSLKKPFTTEELISKAKSALTMKSSMAQPVETEEYRGFGGREDTLTTEEALPEFEETVKETSSFDRTIKMTEDTESFDKTEIGQMGSEMEFEKAEHIEPLSKEPEVTAEPERPYTLKKNIRRRGMRNRLPIPIIAAAVIVIILGGAGFMLYKKNLLPWMGTKPQKAAEKPAQPVQPAQQQDTKVPSSQEQQKAQQPVVEIKAAPAAKSVPVPVIPVSKPEAKKPAPVPTPAPKAQAKPEVKPTGKAIYSVQIGAFKNEANATSLTKQYKDKGYEAFTHKSQKDREMLYRVLIGKFENSKEASKLAQTITTKEKAKTVIFKE